MDTHRAALGLPLLALALGSCAGESYSHVANQCQSNADCNSNTTCDMAMHVCVSQSASTQLVFVGFPAGGQDTSRATATVQDPRVVTANAVSVDIQLRSPRIVFGTVSAPDGTPIAADIRFDREGLVPTSQTIDVNASPMLRTAANGLPYSYTAQLASGVYDVTVTPSNLTPYTPSSPAYPPYYLAAQTIESDASGAPLQLDIAYPTPTSFAGTLTDVTTARGAPGLQLQAIDPAAGERPVSTVGTSASAMGSVGAFSIVLSPGIPTNWHLRIVSQPTATPPPGVTTGRLIYDTASTMLHLDSGYAGHAIAIPSAVASAGAVSGTCDLCQDVQMIVDGTTSMGSEVPLDGATVDLVSESLIDLPAMTGVQSRYEAHTVTAQDGSFHVQLMPGTYRAVITPSDATHFAVSAQVFDVPNHAYVGRVLEVHPLVAVRGSVQGIASGAMEGTQPMAGVTVRAIPVPAMWPDEFTPMPIGNAARGAQFATLADGTFALPLDEGDYLLVLQPPDGSGFATQVFQGLSVTWDPSAPATTPQTLDRGELDLTAPFTVSGTVFDSTSVAVPMAVVRAFATYASADGSMLDVDLGRAVADTTGAYSLLVPSTPIQ